MRLHVGSGTVYLLGYVNVDVPSSRTFLAAARADLAARYETDAEHYYLRHADHAHLDAFRAGPRDDAYVCDAYGRWDCLPCRDGEAEEVLARQSFEHLSEGEAHAALLEVHRALGPGGRLRLSVPDHEATLAAFAATRDPVLVRHLLGPRNGARAFHLMSYTHTALRALVEAHGFAFDGEEPSPHAYPALCLAWRRSA